MGKNYKISLERYALARALNSNLKFAKPSRDEALSGSHEANYWVLGVVFASDAAAAALLGAGVRASQVVVISRRGGGGGG